MKKKKQKVEMNFSIVVVAVVFYIGALAYGTQNKT